MSMMFIPFLAVLFFVLYWSCPRGLRDPFAALVFVAYIGYLDLLALVIMSAISVFTYWSAHLKLLNFRYSPLIIVAGALVYFKYLPENLFGSAGVHDSARVLIPLGISYLTFRLIHYYIEQIRGRLKPHSFVEFIMYCFFVPIYIAGPIQRFDKFLAGRSTVLTRDDVFYAFSRILSGLLKTISIPYILLAIFGYYDHHGLDEMYSQPEEHSAGRLWFGLCFYTFYFYLNLSGYTDLAIGSARLLGFRISENFANPFLARDFVEFWQRWHMTLGDWVKRYVFFPVAKKTSSIVTSLIVSFMFVGIWHAASLNWILWGLFQAVAVMVSYKLQPFNPLGFLPRVPRQIVGSTIVFLVFSLSMSLVMIPAGMDFSNFLRLAPRLFGL